ncbi:MAG: hypothetical protein OJF49_002869 [Ktedonobacterales bacterium]|nr:MAG: hypothetical protein OJF49_002869 [Ktedonobacterales bacterium]
MKRPSRPHLTTTQLTRRPHLTTRDRTRLRAQPHRQCIRMLHYPHTHQPHREGLAAMRHTSSATIISGHSIGRADIPVCPPATSATPTTVEQTFLSAITQKSAESATASRAISPNRQNWQLVSLANIAKSASSATPRIMRFYFLRRTPVCPEPAQAGLAASGHSGAVSTARSALKVEEGARTCVA